MFTLIHITEKCFTKSVPLKPSVNDVLHDPQASISKHFTHYIGREFVLYQFQSLSLSCKSNTP